MTVRFKMTNKGEVAILPRKDYEALAAKAQEVDEDIGRPLPKQQRTIVPDRHVRATRSVRVHNGADPHLADDAPPRPPIWIFAVAGEAIVPRIAVLRISH
jgi:hypothetical protein